MAVIHRHHHLTTEGVTTSETAETVTGLDRAIAALRIAFGFTFLWAFLDKAFALGFATGKDEAGTVDYFGDAAWINGGSPTEGSSPSGSRPTTRSRRCSTRWPDRPGSTGSSCSASSASA